MNWENYLRVGCLKERRRRGERLVGGYIKVIGKRFLSDPCRMQHEYILGKYCEEIGNRHVYKELQHIRHDPSSAEKKPVKIYLDMLSSPFDAENEQMDDSIRAAIRRSGYKDRRRTISRSVGVWANRTVKMDNVPPEFRTLRDGSTFLHYQTSGFHIYHSEATIQKACAAGLHSIVADGLHSPQPKSLGNRAQLYCVHGVCSHGVEVPLLYSTTSKKTEEVYKKIFGYLKINMTGDAPRRTWTLKRQQ